MAAPRTKEELSERDHAVIRAIANALCNGDIDAVYAGVFAQADKVDADRAEDQRRRGVTPQDVRISLKATRSKVIPR